MVAKLPGNYDDKVKRQAKGAAMTNLLRRIVGLGILASLLMMTKPAEAAVKFSLSGNA